MLTKLFYPFTGCMTDLQVPEHPRRMLLDIYRPILPFLRVYARCPKYPNTHAGCRMVTDPQDSCCQIPQCENPNTNNPTQVITGVPGTIEGNSLPPQNPNPLQPKASEFLSCCCWHAAVHVGCGVMAVLHLYVSCTLQVCVSAEV